MRPYTDNYQKSMIPVHGIPLLKYIVDGLKYAGFKDFIFVTGYLKEQVMEYFNDGAKFEINVEYVEQTKLNGTGGALLLCEDLIKEQHFFLTWGDILVPFSIYKRLVDTFKNKKDDFLLVGNYQEDLHKGCALYCKGNYCVKMVEKPPKSQNNSSNLNNCGVFILSKKIFDVLKTLTPSPRGELEIPEAISKGINEFNWKVRVLKMKQGMFRGDFGDPSIYEKLNEDDSWIDELKSS